MRSTARPPAPPGTVAGQAERPARTMPAAVAQPDVLSGVDALIDQGRQSGWAMRVNALTGVLAAAVAGRLRARPAVFTPDRRWSPDAPGLRVLTDLLATLGAQPGDQRYLAGRSRRRPPPRPAPPTTPSRRRAQELSPDVPGADPGQPAPTSPACGRRSAVTPQTTDPALVLDPLDVALDAAGVDGVPASTPPSARRTWRPSRRPPRASAAGWRSPRPATPTPWPRRRRRWC